LENLRDGVDINREWENIKENKKKKPQPKTLGLYELNQHKPRFDDECLLFFFILKEAG
jgi:hypothetical protein